MTQEELRMKLEGLGFKSFQTRAKTYKLALISSNKKSTVYFLLRRFGVDFIYYGYLRPTKSDEKGLLYTDESNGKRVRNSYAGSELDIHRHIYELGELFTQNIAFLDSWLEDNGFSRSDKKREYLKKYDKSSKSELLEIFGDIPSTDGGYKNIAEGMWLTPDGVLTEEGPMF